jgi:hypothetical protein
MTGDRVASVLFVVLAMTLVLSGLVARRLPIRRTIGTAAAWVGIFALAFAVASLFS